MANIKQHLIIFLLLAILISYGILTNNAQLGIIFGAAFGILFDPLIIISGILIGLSKSYKKLLINSVIVSIVALVIIHIQVSEWQASIGSTRTSGQLLFVNLIRYFDILFIAHLVNIPVAISNKKTKFQPTQSHQSPQTDVSNKIELTAPQSRTYSSKKTIGSFNKNKLWLLMQISWVLLVIFTTKYRSYPELIYLFYSFVGTDLRTNGFVQIVVMAFPFLTNLYSWIKK
jgi:hypothetical protein